MTYTVWYIPDGWSEPLTRTFRDDDFPPYHLGDDERVSFMLDEVGEMGEPLEIRRTDVYSQPLWQNKSWGID